MSVVLGIMRENWCRNLLRKVGGSVENELKDKMHHSKLVAATGLFKKVGMHY